MTANSLSVINFLKDHFGTEYTKKQLADALHLTIPAINGSVNFLVKKGFCDERIETYEEEPATEFRKAKIKTIRYNKLNESGLAYDPEAEEEAKQAAKKAEREAKLAAREAAKKSEENN